VDVLTPAHQAEHRVRLFRIAQVERFLPLSSFFFSFRGGFNGLLPGFALFSGFKLKHTLIFMGRIPRCLRRYVNNNSNEDTPLLAAGSFIRGFSEHVQEEPVRETNLKIRGVIGEIADLMIFLSETSLLIERRKRNASIRYFAQLISANIHGLHGAFGFFNSYLAQGTYHSHSGRVDCSHVAKFFTTREIPSAQTYMNRTKAPLNMIMGSSLREFLKKVPR
jgi:hypothetical protein